MVVPPEEQKAQNNGYCVERVFQASIQMTLLCLRYNKLMMKIT